MTTRYFKYDIFVSHNRADKEWARELARKIAVEEYNGRLLRPLPDEQFLDPDDLKSNEELSTCLKKMIPVVFMQNQVSQKQITL